MKTIAKFIWFGLVASALSIHEAQADTITVTNTNCGGPGSLSQALEDANNGDTINFDPSLDGGTIQCTFRVNKSVIINGPGPNHLTIRHGGTAGPAIEVTGGVTATISGLAITGRPGGLSKIGIRNDHCALTLINCNIHHNNATATSFPGGGIVNSGGGAGRNATLVVLNSTISDNTERGNFGGGGGIINIGSGGGNAMLSVINSTLSGNRVVVFDRFDQRPETGGGAIYNLVDRSTPAGSATLSVINSTLSGNRAEYGQGGGIYSSLFTSLSIRNSTLRNNTAASYSGGIFNLGEGTVGSTIFDASTMDLCCTHLRSIGYNLSSGSLGFPLGRGDQSRRNPLLGPLQNNGGPTLTHGLLPGSPAINAGDPNFTPPPDYDQRGPDFLRVANGRIDIGSFEVQAGPPVTPTPTPEPTSTPRPTPTPRP